MEKQMELFEEGGLKDEGGMIDEESGNEVPVGGTRKGVRDDIPANVSEGEFIFPEDVTRYIGLDKLMQLRQEAKMGLKRMEAMGQMGNSDEATMEDDLPFGMADLIIVGGIPEGEDELDMAVGGLTTTSTGSRRTVAQPTVQEPTTPITTQPTVTRRLTPEPIVPEAISIDFKNLMGEAAIEYKEYRNAAGESMMISFIGGEPVYPIPDGYTLYTGEGAVGSGTVGTTADSIAYATNTATAEYRQSGGDNDTSPPMPTAKAINWDSLSTEELIEESSKLTGMGATIAKGAMAFLGPFGAIGYAMMRHQDKKVAQEIANRIAKGGLTASQLATLKETQEKLTPKGFTLIGKVIETVGRALGFGEDEVETTKKTAGVSENAANRVADAATNTEEVATTIIQEIVNANQAAYEEAAFGAAPSAQAAADLPGELGPIQSVSTANMAGDIAEDGAKYAQDMQDAANLYKKVLLKGDEPLPQGQTKEDIVNSIIERVGVDGFREIESNIRPDMVSPYGPVPNAALQNVDRELYRMPESDRERLKSLKLSEPGSQMTTEQQIEERKRLASAYQQPQALIDPRIAPTTTAPSGFAGDQPPIASTAVPEPVATQTENTYTPSYDMFGNPQITPEVRNAVDRSYNNRGKFAQLMTDTDRLLGVGAFGPKREPLSDVDPDLQLESVTPFAPKLSAVPQPSNIDVVPPSPVTNLDLRPQTAPLLPSQKEPNQFKVATGSPIVDTSNLAGISAVSGPDAFDPRNLGGSEGYGSTAQQTQQAFNTNVYTPPSSIGLPKTDVPTTVDTSVYTQPSSMSLTPTTTSRTFDEEFAAQRKAGAKEFSYDRDGDGKLERYTTQTAEEAAPAGTNTLVQNVKNLFTPFDDKEYVGGVLKETATTPEKASSKTTAKTYNSIADAIKDGQSGKAVNIKGKGVQKAELADKTYQAKLEKSSKTTTKTKDTSGTTVESVVNTNAVNKTGSDVTVGKKTSTGQDAGDGFVWEKKAGTNALTRTWVGTTDSSSSSNDDDGGSSSSSDSGGGCCFIMLEARYGDGTMDEVVRRYRDEHMTDRNRRGYYKVAEVLVPLMRKSQVIKWLVTKTFADPLVSYGKYYYGQNKHGVLYSPLKSLWMKLFDTVGGDTEFIRENGEVV